MRVSFIICSHRAPASTLDTLASLGRQSRQELAEVILVNNGFPKEREAQLVDHAKAHGLTAPFRIVPEPVPGLGYSRKRGFLEAKGEWLVLLDDDNTVAPDFLAVLIDKLEKHPRLGGITALISPVWETSPPPWLVEFGANCLSYNSASTFRSRPLEKLFGENTAHLADRPAGGGMIIHRSVAAHYLRTADDPVRLSLERTGDSLVGCQDADIWRGIASLGMDVLVTDSLRIEHHIPASRLGRKYLIRLNHQMAYSYAMLGLLLGERKPASPFRDGLRQTVKTVRHLKIGLTSGPFFQQLLEIAKSWGDYRGACRRVPTSSNRTLPS